MATPTELARIAALANALRPEWPTRSVLTLLEREHSARAYRDLAVAMAYVATDAKTQTPKRLSESGPWWQTTGEPTPSAVPGARDPRCTVYGHEHYHLPCRGCRADELAAQFEAEQAAGMTPGPLVDEAQAHRNAHGARTVLDAAPIDVRRRAAGEREEADDE